MMDVRELRIGSLVFVSYRDGVYEISSISKNEAYGGRYELKSKNGDKISLDYAKPIPLTEELLLRIGFSYEEIEDCWKIRGLFIKKEDCGFRIYIECEDAWYSDCYFETFKYLHQLQNIYFDLTDKELEIKL